MKQAVRQPQSALMLAFVCALFVGETAGLLFRPVFGDEIPILANIGQFAEARTLVPADFSYPALFSYAAAAWTGFVAVAMWIARGQHPVDFGFGLIWSVEGSAEFGPEILLVRVFVMLQGLALVALTYHLGRSAWGVQEGLVASVLVAASNILVERSAWLLPDVPASLVTTAAVLFCLDSRRSAVESTSGLRRRNTLLLAAAAAVGVAAAMKFNAAIACLGVLAAALIGGWGWLPGRRWLHGIRQLTLLSLVAVVTFVACMPALVIAPAEYWSAFLFEAEHMRAGQLSVDLGEYPYAWIAIRLLQHEAALGALLLATIVALPWLRRDPVARVLGLPVLGAMAIVGGWRYTSLHYLLWTFPLLAVIGARLLVLVLPKTAVGSWTLAVVVLSVAAPNVGLSLAKSIRAATVPDNQLAAERWIESNIAPGERVDEDWYGLPTLWNSRTRERFQLLLDRHGERLAPLRTASVRQKPIYTGSLGFVITPPDAQQLAVARPTWVVTSSEIEPESAAPLAGYRSESLIALHLRLAHYYGALRQSGNYELVKAFADGPGHRVRVFRRSARD